jgi:hypothetical protein
LRTGKEGFETVAIHDQAAFGFADNRTADDGAVFERIHNAFPGAEDFCFAARKTEIGLGFPSCAFYVYFYIVALFEIWRIAEFAQAR